MDKDDKGEKEKPKRPKSASGKKKTKMEASKKKKKEKNGKSKVSSSNPLSSSKSERPVKEKKQSKRKSRTKSRSDQSFSLSPSRSVSSTRSRTDNSRRNSKSSSQELILSPSPNRKSRSRSSSPQNSEHLKERERYSIKSKTSLKKSNTVTANIYKRLGMDEKNTDSTNKASFSSRSSGSENNVRSRFTQRRQSSHGQRSPPHYRGAGSPKASSSRYRRSQSPEMSSQYRNRSPTSNRRSPQYRAPSPEKSRRSRSPQYRAPSPEKSRPQYRRSVSPPYRAPSPEKSRPQHRRRSQSPQYRRSVSPTYRRARSPKTKKYGTEESPTPPRQKRGRSMEKSSRYKRSRTPKNKTYRNQSTSTDRSFTPDRNPGPSPIRSISPDIKPRHSPNRYTFPDRSPRPFPNTNLPPDIKPRPSPNDRSPQASRNEERAHQSSSERSFTPDRRPRSSPIRYESPDKNPGPSPSRTRYLSPSRTRYLSPERQKMPKREPSPHETRVKRRRNSSPDYATLPERNLTSPRVPLSSHPRIKTKQEREQSPSRKVQGFTNPTYDFVDIADGNSSPEYVAPIPSPVPLYHEERRPNLKVNESIKGEKAKNIGSRRASSPEIVGDRTIRIKTSPLRSCQPGPSGIIQSAKHVDHINYAPRRILTPNTSTSLERDFNATGQSIISRIDPQNERYDAPFNSSTPEIIQNQPSSSAIALNKARSILNLPFRREPSIQVVDSPESPPRAPSVVHLQQPKSERIPLEPPPRNQMKRSQVRRPIEMVTLDDSDDDIQVARPPSPILEVRPPSPILEARPPSPILEARPPSPIFGLRPPSPINQIPSNQLSADGLSPDVSEPTVWSEISNNVYQVPRPIQLQIIREGSATAYLTFQTIENAVKFKNVFNEKFLVTDFPNLSFTSGILIPSIPDVIGGVDQSLVDDADEAGLVRNSWHIPAVMTPRSPSPNLLPPRGAHPFLPGNFSESMTPRSPTPPPIVDTSAYIQKLSKDTLKQRILFDKNKRIEIVYVDVSVNPSNKLEITKLEIFLPIGAGKMQRFFGRPSNDLTLSLLNYVEKKMENLNECTLVFVTNCIASFKTFLQNADLKHFKKLFQLHTDLEFIARQKISNNLLKSIKYDEKRLTNLCNQLKVVINDRPPEMMKNIANALLRNPGEIDFDSKEILPYCDEYELPRKNYLAIVLKLEIIEVRDHESRKKCDAIATIGFDIASKENVTIGLDNDVEPYWFVPVTPNRKESFVTPMIASLFGFEEKKNNLEKCWVYSKNKNEKCKTENEAFIELIDKLEDIVLIISPMDDTSFSLLTAAIYRHKLTERFQMIVKGFGNIEQLVKDHGLGNKFSEINLYSLKNPKILPGCMVKLVKKLLRGFPTYDNFYGKYMQGVRFGLKENSGIPILDEDVYYIEMDETKTIPAYTEAIPSKSTVTITVEVVDASLKDVGAEFAVKCYGHVRPLSPRPFRSQSSNEKLLLKFDLHNLKEEITFNKGERIGRATKVKMDVNDNAEERSKKLQEKLAKAKGRTVQRNISTKDPRKKKKKAAPPTSYFSSEVDDAHNGVHYEIQASSPGDAAVGSKIQASPRADAVGSKGSTPRLPVKVAPERRAFLLEVVPDRPESSNSPIKVVSETRDSPSVKVVSKKRASSPLVTSDPSSSLVEVSPSVKVASKKRASSPLVASDISSSFVEVSKRRALLPSESSSSPSEIISRTRVFPPAVVPHRSVPFFSAVEVSQRRTSPPSQRSESSSSPVEVIAESSVSPPQEVSEEPSTSRKAYSPIIPERKDIVVNSSIKSLKKKRLHSTKETLVGSKDSRSSRRGKEFVSRATKSSSVSLARKPKSSHESKTESHGKNSQYRAGSSSRVEIEEPQRIVNLSTANDIVEVLEPDVITISQGNAVINVSSNKKRNKARPNTREEHIVDVEEEMGPDVVVVDENENEPQSEIFVVQAKNHGVLNLKKGDVIEMTAIGPLKKGVNDNVYVDQDDPNFKSIQKKNDRAKKKQIHNSDPKTSSSRNNAQVGSSSEVKSQESSGKNRQVVSREASINLCSEVEEEDDDVIEELPKEPGVNIDCIQDTHENKLKKVENTSNISKIPESVGILSGDSTQEIVVQDIENVISEEHKNVKLSQMPKLSEDCDIKGISSQENVIENVDNTITEVQKIERALSAYKSSYMDEDGKIEGASPLPSKMHDVDETMPSINTSKKSNNTYEDFQKSKVSLDGENNLEVVDGYDTPEDPFIEEDSISDVRPLTVDPSIPPTEENVLKSPQELYGICPPTPNKSLGAFPLDKEDLNNLEDEETDEALSMLTLEHDRSIDDTSPLIPQLQAIKETLEPYSGVEELDLCFAMFQEQFRDLMYTLIQFSQKTLSDLEKNEKNVNFGDHILAELQCLQLEGIDDIPQLNDALNQIYEENKDANMTMWTEKFKEKFEGFKVLDFDIDLAIQIMILNGIDEIVAT